MGIYYVPFLLRLALYTMLMSPDTVSGSRPRISRQPKSGTALLNHRFSFHCESIDGDQTTWEHNRFIMNNKNRRYRLLHHGTLRILKVKVTDRGRYRCRVKNKDGSVYSKPAYLTVHAPAEFVEEKSNFSQRTVQFGQLIQLKCLVAGIPSPVVNWYKKGKKITREGEIDLKNFQGEQVFRQEKASTHTKVLLFINVTEPNDYECVAYNNPIGGTKNISRTVKIRFQTKTDNRHLGYCDVYTGSVCKPYIGHRTVFFSQSHENPAILNERITRNLWAELIEDFESFCQIPAGKLLCEYAFPVCHDSDDQSDNNHIGLPKPVPICREACLAVKNLFCFDEWIMVNNRKKENNFLKHRGHFRLPNCNKLPSKWNTSERCSLGGLFDHSPELVNGECYVGTGQWYNGSVNITSSGYECQAWTAQEPHEHLRDPRVFPELEHSFNYCRNPGSEEKGPWCYIKRTNVTIPRWELCDIPQCTDVTTSTDMIGDPSDFLVSPQIPWYIALIITVLSSSGLLGFAFVLLMCRRALFLKNKSVKYKPTPQQDVEIDLETVPTNVSYHRVADVVRLHPKLECFEYPRNDIVYMRDIGQGAFGRVFQAKAPNLTKGDDVFIAVKMLKEDASDELQCDFEREALLMSAFAHDNIVRLLAVCALGKPMCLLFEYMSKGDLNEFLRLCSPEQYVICHRAGLVTNETLGRHILDTIDQLEIGTQIASGMLYLSERGYVHRDLATRNCLVGDDLTVKISDFGLARSVHSMEYYEGSDNDAIPIRWMPLEAILYNRFSTESDVWSFGVVLWEIFSFALQPYYGMTHEEVVTFIKENNMLQCPDGASPRLYALMTHCWNHKPTSRPTFSTMHNTLSSLHEELITHTQSNKTTDL